MKGAVSDELQMVPLSGIRREVLIWASVVWLTYPSFLQNLFSPCTGLLQALSTFVLLVVISIHWSFSVSEQTEYLGKGGRRVLMMAHLGEEIYFFSFSKSTTLLGL